MVILITGATHTGKTLLSQKLLEKYQYPYLSLDHLKMGLVRSGYTTLTPEDSIEDLTNYLWPIIVGIIKTNIENKQNIIIEGCYIPFNYKSYFTEEYLNHIKYKCLIFSKTYCYKHYNDIINYASTIEERETIESMDVLVKENKFYLENCINYNCDYILIKDKYQIEFII